MGKITVPQIVAKKGKEKITSITAYDILIASLEDEIGFDIILVGDSAGTTLLGYSSTLPVRMDEMLVFSKAVSRGVKRALLVGDMPFLSYQVSKEEALRNAGRFIQEGGMDAVKLEGGEEIAETITHIIKAGIPVMGHLGLTPQGVLKMGGYKVQGRTESSAKKLMGDVKILEGTGVFSIVLEGIPENLARDITASLKIPTIGIGAGNFTDGQIIVVWDILGLTPPPHPKFVKKYLNLREDIRTALKNFKEEVIKGEYPGEEYIYK